LFKGRPMQEISSFYLETAPFPLPCGEASPFSIKRPSLPRPQLTVAHFEPCRLQPLWTVTLGVGVDVEAREGLCEHGNGAKLGGVSAREIVDNTGRSLCPRLFMVRAAWVLPEYRRQGIGRALYLAAARALPGILIRSACPSHLAIFLWRALSDAPGAVVVESPYPVENEAPRLIYGVSGFRDSGV